MVNCVFYRPFCFFVCILFFMTPDCPTISLERMKNEEDDLDISLKSQSCKSNVNCKSHVYSKERFSSRSDLGPKLMEYHSSCSSSQSFHRDSFLESPWALRHIEIFTILHSNQLTRLLPFLSLQTENTVEKRNVSCTAPASCA